MKKNLNIANHVAFRLECKLVNMTAEYGSDHLGDAEWMIFTDLSEKELASKYAEELKDYSPYAYMTLEMYEPVLESNNNDRKHRWRMENTYDLFDFVDGEMERFHPGLAEIEEAEDYEPLYEALNQLTVMQRRNVIRYYFDGYNCPEIAAMDGITSQGVNDSLQKALKKLRKILASA